MTAEERARGFAELWGLGRDAEGALVELLHQHADETLSFTADALRLGEERPGKDKVA